MYVHTHKCMHSVYAWIYNAVSSNININVWNDAMYVTTVSSAIMYNQYNLIGWEKSQNYINTLDHLIGFLLQPVWFNQQIRCFADWLEPNDMQAHLIRYKLKKWAEL